MPGPAGQLEAAQVQKRLISSPSAGNTPGLVYTGALLGAPTLPKCPLPGLMPQGYGGSPTRQPLPRQRQHWCNHLGCEFAPSLPPTVSGLEALYPSG